MWSIKENLFKRLAVSVPLVLAVVVFYLLFQPSLLSPAAQTRNLGGENIRQTAAGLAPVAPGGEYQLVNATYRPGHEYLVGRTGLEVSEPIKVRVLDQAGQPVEGVPVMFEVVGMPDGSKGAALDPGNAVSDQAGEALSHFRLGSKGGDYVVIARAENIAGSTPYVKIKAMEGKWWILVIVGLLGGLALFLYGLELSASGLQKVAGDKMRSILSTITNNRFMGVIVGTVTTALLQSSSATTVMVVGFVSAALMSLPNAIGVILGANIGTTFTVQLIAFRITDYALLMVGLGFGINAMAKRKVYRYLGQIVMGFGLIFFGMHVMSLAMAPLKSIPGFRDSLLSLGDRPFITILFSALFTGLIQSSGATIGLALTLGGEGLLDLQGAVPIILGANIGTTVTALLTLPKASTDGRRTAVAHLLFNVGGVLIFFPFLTWFCSGTEALSNYLAMPAMPRQIANAHLVFNVLNTIIFLPFTVSLAWLVCKFIPERERVEKSRYAPKYLNNDLLETPELAIEASKQEVLRIAGISRHILDDLGGGLNERSSRFLEKLRQGHEEVEALSHEFMRYYTRLIQKDLSLFQSHRLMFMFSSLDDLRRLARILGEEGYELLGNMIGGGLKFSPAGHNEIMDFYSNVMIWFDKSVKLIESEDPEMARNLIETKSEITEAERRLRTSHLDRLNSGLKETIETSSIHLDILSLLKRVQTVTVRVSRSLLDLQVSE